MIIVIKVTAKTSLTMVKVCWEGFDATSFKFVPLNKIIRITINMIISIKTK